MQACPYDPRFIHHETQTADKCTVGEHRLKWTAFSHHGSRNGKTMAPNGLGFADPSRGKPRNVWIDAVSGAVVRQGLPVRIERV